MSVSKGRVEDPLLRVVMNFQQSMALDTVKNEYALHRQIHGTGMHFHQLPFVVEYLHAGHADDGAVDHGLVPGVDNPAGGRFAHHPAGAQPAVTFREIFGV